MNSLTSTARLTGAAYLALAIAGPIGYVGIRSALVGATPSATLENLAAQPALAHAGVAVELVIVIAQALAALGFFALLRHDRPTLAFGVAAFGMANATAILLSAVFLSTALTAHDAAAVGLLYALSEGCWTVGGIFFGLWLLPMGWFAVSTRRMPRVLGWLLVGGGAAYLVGTFTAVISPELAIVSAVLPLLATVGEVWMLGYLLVIGIRPARIPSLTGAAA